MFCNIHDVYYHILETDATENLKKQYFTFVFAL